MFWKTNSSRKSTVVPLASAALLVVFSTGAIGAEGRWTEGFGQGNLEYFIDARGWRLYIGCPTQDGSADAFSSVEMISTATDRHAPKFTIRVGGNVYDGPIDAQSRAGSGAFRSLLSDLRRTDAVVLVGNATVTFSKSNVAKVVPVYGKGFSCNLF